MHYRSDKGSKPTEKENKGNSNSIEIGFLKNSFLSRKCKNSTFWLIWFGYFWVKEKKFKTWLDIN